MLLTSRLTNLKLKFGSLPIQSLEESKSSASQTLMSSDEPPLLKDIVLFSTNVRFTSDFNPHRIMVFIRSMIKDPIIKSSAFKIKAGQGDNVYKLQLFKDKLGYIIEYRKVRGCHFKLAETKTRILNELKLLSFRGSRTT